MGTVSFFDNNDDNKVTELISKFSNGTRDIGIYNTLSF